MGMNFVILGGLGSTIVGETHLLNDTWQFAVIAQVWVEGESDLRFRAVLL